MSHYLPSVCCISQQQYIFFQATIFFNKLRLGHPGCLSCNSSPPFLSQGLVPMLTVSFLGSRSKSRRSREVLTFRASDRAISPPVLISFSRRSRRSSLGLSAMNSATATAPIAQWTERHGGVKKMQKIFHKTAEAHRHQFPPSQDNLVEARPSLSTERLAISPSLSLWTPSLPTKLWPRFRVSRLWVQG